MENAKQEEEVSHFVRTAIENQSLGLNASFYKARSASSKNVLLHVPHLLPPSSKRCSFSTSRTSVRRESNYMTRGSICLQSCKIIRSPSCSGRPQYQPVSMVSKNLQEITETTILSNYWNKKEQINRKYQDLLNQLQCEELVEIKHCALKYESAENCNTSTSLLEAINQIKECYEELENLLMRQKLLEQEDVIALFKGAVAGPYI